jgi:hypothetical protein
MKVARHEMPGKRIDPIRPVGNGVIRWLRALFAAEDNRTSSPTNHAVPYGTGSRCRVFQAFHAWLPSCGPFGTETLLHSFVHLKGFRHLTRDFENP